MVCLQSCTTIPVIRLDKLNFPHLPKDPYKHPGVFTPVIGWLEILPGLVPKPCGKVMYSYVFLIGLLSVFLRMISLESSLQIFSLLVHRALCCFFCPCAGISEWLYNVIVTHICIYKGRKMFWILILSGKKIKITHPQRSYLLNMR